MADLRERGTTIRQSSDDTSKGHAVDLAMSVTSVAAPIAIVSLLVDDVLARIGIGIDFSDLFVVESTPTVASVRSLTDVLDGELSTPNGVIINAAGVMHSPSASWS